MDHLLRKDGANEIAGFPGMSAEEMVASAKLVILTVEMAKSTTFIRCRWEEMTPWKMRSCYAGFAISMPQTAPRSFLNINDEEATIPK